MNTDFVKEIIFWQFLVDKLIMVKLPFLSECQLQHIPLWRWLENYSHERNILHNVKILVHFSKKKNLRTGCQQWWLVYQFSTKRTWVFSSRAILFSYMTLKRIFPNTAPWKEPGNIGIGWESKNKLHLVNILLLEPGYWSRGNTSNLNSCQ